MAVVHLPQALMFLTRGQTEIVVDAPRVVELRAILDGRFPGLQAALDEMAVAIDGQIHTDADYMRLEKDTEVHFVPHVSGGA
jgi:molybdopterin converting factor small subunit